MRKSLVFHRCPEVVLHKRHHREKTSIGAGCERECEDYPADLKKLRIGFFQSSKAFECYGEFGASGCARTMKIGRRVRDLQKLT